MTEKYMMALDQGTTSSRCIIYDKKGNAISSMQKKFRQIFPKPGWVEHDPDEIWDTILECSRGALDKAGLTYENIAGIGITNQRETTIVWDRNTGAPVYNAIVWQCRRTAGFCETLKDKADIIRKKTGLVVDPYFSGTKIRWILDNVTGARERAEKGDLIFGTVETWLIWKLTGGRVHVTDYSNASRTMLFNINSIEWDKEILNTLEIPETMLPKPVPSSFVYGETDSSLFGGPIRISGAAGDQQCALFGQTCFEKGDAKNTYGTGGFMLMNIGTEPVLSESGLLTTIAWGLDGKVYYALEGSFFIAAAVFQWVRDGLGLIKSSSEVEAMARAVEDTGGVYLVPAFVGLGAPYWDPYARGAIQGITRGTNGNHIVRAAVESIAYQVHDLMAAMESDSGIKIENLRVDGGASANDFLLEFQAGLTGCAVDRPKNVETTSLGAAYLAGLAVGYYESTDDIKDNWQLDRKFSGGMDEETGKKLLAGWHKAVNSTRGWALE